MTTPASLLLTELSADPTALPASGQLGIYSKTGDGLYTINSSGTVAQIGGTSGVTPGSYTNTNLTVNAAGIITAASNGSGGGGGTPGGANMQVQFNNSGAFGGDSDLTYAGNGNLTIGDNTTSYPPTLYFQANTAGGQHPSLLMYGNGYPGDLGIGISYTNYASGASIFSEATSINISSGGTVTVGNQLVLTTTGTGLTIAEAGGNAKQGTVTLVSGTPTTTVSTTVVTASSRIYVTGQSDNGGTPGFLRVNNIVPGTSFDIVSSSSGDSSIVAWLIIEAI